MSLVSILVVLLVFCLVIWAARAIMVAFGIGDPIATVVYVVLVFVLILWLLSLIGIVPPIRIR